MKASQSGQTNPEALLKAAYEQLGFAAGSLLPASKLPAKDTEHDWLDKGDWLALAEDVGAEKVFFVGQNPVAVFARATDGGADALRRLYNRIWCMARPQLLFLARPGELAVYDLAKPPIKPGEAPTAHNRLLDIAETVADVQSRLASYHREKIETGALFGEERFGNNLDRADRALIRDLKAVRHELMNVKPVAGQKRPTLHHLHSLIGRAIFIRYLEDRKVLTRDYFEAVAARRRDWAKLLGGPLPRPSVEPELGNLCFLRVLQDKDFTYALFEQLAEDFNGDTFPIDDEERAHVHEGHLQKLLGFLVGETSDQESLFFFAYRFDVIPIELISSIYEEFYTERRGNECNQASHYTPLALVEFVLAQTLTPDVLAQNPRVMDAACGSGIFLVESFRRMVRHKAANSDGKRLTRPQLRKILREQIAGMDINEEAVHVAAFSLYLAFLHYQEPREINEERRLPYLKWVTPEEKEHRRLKRPQAEFYDLLLHENAFAPASGKALPEIAQRFGSECADVIVGNPPWGYPKREDEDGHKALATTLAWCKPEKGRPIGDKELSQAFIHLSLSLLRDGGRAGLLVSSGVLFKHHENSRSFRQVWLNASRLRQVVNFAHVRKVFFSSPARDVKGIAPFISVVFEKTPNRPDANHRFDYWSAKRTAMVENTQAVVLSKGDMHWLAQRDCLSYEKLWKIYWWGGHRDEALVRSMERFPQFIHVPTALRGTKVHTGRGFEKTTKGDPSDWLKNYRELPRNALQSYGPLDLRALRAVPDKVYRKGEEAVYHGHRLLVGRGIVAGGRITARFESHKFCFRNSIHGVRLEGFHDWQERVLAGIFWSSFARYYFFVTAGSWGLWHDEILLENVEQMPICFPEDNNLRTRIVRVVEELQSLELQPEGLELGGLSAQKRLPQLEQQLNDAIFDLYGLTETERDLVREMCSLGLDFFYRNQKSDAVEALAPPPRSWGTHTDVAHSDSGLGSYLRIFLQVWNAELEPDGELAWRVLSPPSGAPLLAVSFVTRFKNKPVAPPSDGDAEAWRKLLKKLDKDTRLLTGSSSVFTDTFFRLIGEREMVFIKRNEARFWTRTAAREDAEAALVRLMQDEEGRREEGR